MKKWFNSFGHALDGIIFFFKTERNARIELFFSCIAISLSLWLQISHVEFCIILLCIAAVLSAEAFNSAIERLADIHHPGYDSRVKKVKDVAAGAVLLFSFIALLIGSLILGPEILLAFDF